MGKKDQHAQDYNNISIIWYQLQTHLCYARFVSTKVFNVFNEAVKIFEFIHGGPKYHYLRYTTTVHRCHLYPDVTCHIIQ